MANNDVEEVTLHNRTPETLMIAFIGSRGNERRILLASNQVAELEVKKNPLGNYYFAINPAK